MLRFSIRDVLWLTLLAGLTMAWWLDRRRAEQALEAKAQELSAAAQKENNLQRQVKLLGDIVQAGEVELAKRDAELRDSLQRREATTLDILRKLNSASAPTN